MWRCSGHIWRRFGLILSLLCFLATPGAWADSAHIAQEIGKPHLLGAGTFRWLGLKIYHAQLWVGPSGFHPGQAPLALNLRYARSLYGAKIAEASAQEITKLGIATPLERSQWLERMRQIFPDVKKGSEITGVWLARGGARFYLDGVLLGTIDDPSFAQAFFAIWLDPRTSAPALRTALLGKTTVGSAFHEKSP